MQVAHLYISSGHNYFGHHGQAPGVHPIIEVGMIECLAGHGIRGDRFFDYKDNYKGQITLFSGEVFDVLCDALGIYDKPASVLRRNIITREQDLNELIGNEFELQSVRLYGMEECRPCYWMDEAFAPGTEEFLRGRGGLRARILSNGQISGTQAVFVGKR